MQCTSCGATLPPGAKHCPSCGATVYQPGAFQDTLHSSPTDQIPTPGSYSPGTYQETAYPQANPPLDRTVRDNPPLDKTVQGSSSQPGSPFLPPPIPYNQPSYTPPQSAQSPYGSPIQPSQSPYADQSKPAQSPYGAPQQQQPMYMGAQPGFNQQQGTPFLPPSQPPTQPRRGLSRTALIAAVLVAIILIAGGISLIYYTTVYHPNQLHAQATSTAQTSQTRIANATGTANTQATGTAVAISNATATANAQATANVVGTATALQNIYTQATSGSPALNEALSNNTGSNWDVDQAQGGGGCAFTNGAYHSSLMSKGFYFPCIAQNSNFSNFAFQVQMNITSGDYGGLIFRANSSAFKFYSFRLGQDGSYSLFVSTDSTHSTGLLSGNSSLVNKGTGHANLVTVIARSSSLYFYINKQYIGSVSDNTFSAGQIGLFAEDNANPTDVAFSNLQVWKL